MGGSKGGGFFLEAINENEWMIYIPGTLNNYLDINGCFNWMIPNLYLENGCFTKHPFKNGSRYVPRKGLPLTQTYSFRMGLEPSKSYSIGRSLDS